MLGWLKKLDPIHRATTREEREAVYRFRYTVYWEELGRRCPGTDHVRRWIKNEEDESDHTTILYAGNLNEIKGTILLRHWDRGQIPTADMEELSLERFPDIAQRKAAELGRLMIRPHHRNRWLLLSFMKAGCDLLVGEMGTELIFLYCNSGLMAHYRRFGFRTYGAKILNTTDGIMVPMVGIPSDTAYLRRLRTPAWAYFRRYYSSGKLPRIDTAPYQAILGEAGGVEFDTESIWNELEEKFMGDDEMPSFINSLPWEAIKRLLTEGFLLNVPAGTMVTPKGLVEREMYVVVEGLFEVQDDGRRLRLLHMGDLFGEVAFFSNNGQRSASVCAVKDSRILVIRARSLDRLIESDPKVAVKVVMSIAGIMATRVAKGEKIRLSKFENHVGETAIL